MGGTSRHDIPPRLAAWSSTKLGVQRLHDRRRPRSAASSLITLEDLEGIHRSSAALLIELPQQEIGGRLPVGGYRGAGRVCSRTSRRGPCGRRASVECGLLLSRPLAISRPCSTLSTSRFYKGLGGMAAACCWARRTSSPRHANSGTATAARVRALALRAAGLAGLRLRLPRMGELRGARPGNQHALCADRRVECARSATDKHDAHLPSHHPRGLNRRQCVAWGSRATLGFSLLDTC